MDGGYVEIVEKLLYESTVRPNLELRDVSGKTPLDLAETFDMINLMERLNYRSESMFSMNRSNRRRDSFYSQYSMNSPGVRNYDSASYKCFSPASKTCQGNKLFAQSMSSRPVSANSGFSNFLLREVRNKSTVDYKTHAERNPEALEDFVSKFSYSGVEGLHDSVVIFKVGEEGALTYLGEEWTQGNYPRSFSFDPTGRFLYCCNQRSDNVAIFSVDQKSGGIKFTGKFAAVGNPSHIVFLDTKSD